MKILRPERLARSRSGLLYLRSATESSKSFGVPVPAFRTLASNSKTFSRPPDTVRYRSIPTFHRATHDARSPADPYRIVRMEFESPPVFRIFESTDGTTLSRL